MGLLTAEAMAGGEIGAGNYGHPIEGGRIFFRGLEFRMLPFLGVN